MRKLIVSISVVFAVLFASTTGLILYGRFLDHRLRRDINQIRVGMAEAEVIRILGEPSDRMMSDIPGTYWTYETDVLGSLLDDNPNRVGYLVLQMGADGKVVKVFELK